MINLRPFYNPKDYRTYLKKPMNHNGKTIATNGHILIAVPQEREYAQPSEKLSMMIDSILDYQGEYTPLDYKLPIPRKVTCHICNGTGHVETIICKECNGEREIEFHNGYHTYTHDCKSCDATGFTQKEGPCENCEATGKVLPPNAHVNVCGITLDPKYYRVLRKVAPDISVSADTENKVLHFRNSDCEGAMMPISVY